MPNNATCRTTGRGTNPYPANSPWRRKARAHASEIQRLYAVSKPLRLVVSSPQPTEKATEEKFRRLADQWQGDTAAISSLEKIVTHSAYQRIVGMGSAAIPLILREMKRGPNHWFWALDAITEGESPAQGSRTLAEATEAWIQWGIEKGYLREDAE